MVGNQSSIIKSLETMTSPETVKSLNHPHILDGSHEQTILLYRKHSYPYHVIGPTQLLWQQELPNEFKKTLHRSIWLWMHPSCSKEALEELQSQCSDESRKTMTIELVDDLLRFRMIGPSSHTILSDLLHAGEPKPHWLNGISGPEKGLDVCSGDGWEFWKEMAGFESPSSIPQHLVVGLSVADPRHYLPQKKVDMVSKHYPPKKSSKFAVGHTREDRQHQQVSTTRVACLNQAIADKKLAASYLWSSLVRQLVKDNKVSDQEINLERSKLPIPGTHLPTTDKTSCIPLLLIQQESAPDISQFGCGWDIILPAGWAMAFWIALIYRGARVAALKDMERVEVEMGKLSFPQHFPNSFAGQQKATIDQLQAEERYLRYAPDKRPNYVKLGITAPFAASWNKLVEMWTNQQGDEEPKAKKLKASEVHL
jgi:ribonuclease P/MRP protein subunit POP1